MDLETALNVLNIKHEISLIMLKKIYRNLAKKHHPDVSIDAEKILQINEAYKFLKSYLENYSIPVEKLIENNTEERTLKRFKNDWLGGNYE